MAGEQEDTEYRFTRDVRQVAPRVGHHLGTGVFQLGNEEVIVWLVEGPQNDSVGVIGMATDFERTRLMSFAFHGPLFEQLNQLPPAPYDRGLRLRFRGLGDQPSPVLVERADVVFSNLRAAGNPDPDSAAIAYRLRGDQGAARVLVALTGYQRGWLIFAAIVALALVVWVERSRPSSVEGREVALAVEEEREGPGGRFRVEGTIAQRASLMGS
jgi:hypothetical protein